MAIFDNRELALVVWGVAVLVYALLSRRIRPSLAGVVRSAVEPKIAVILLLMVGYGALAVWLLSLVTLWTSGLISETVFWPFGPGLALLFGFVTSRDAEDFFKKTLIAAVGLTVAVEFLINLYPAHLAIELVLVPVFVVIGGGLVLAERDPNLKSAKTALEFFVLLIVLSLFSHTLVSIIRDPGSFTTADNLRELLLPVLLTTAFVPLIYLVGVYASYDGAFVWVRLATEDRWQRRRAKLALITKLRGRTRDIRALTMYWGKHVACAASLREARSKVDEFRAWARERRLAPQRERERLQHFAGVERADEDGRQLDQREFKETKEALRALLFSQMGWYRNQGGRYRTELLEILKPQFEHAGLPDDHGITSHVARDGQSWWAWRRAATGWCLGVGAKGPPPDEWLYDDAKPPTGPPGKKGWSQWGSDARNW